METEEILLFDLKKKSVIIKKTERPTIYNFASLQDSLTVFKAQQQRGRGSSYFQTPASDVTLLTL